MSADIIHLPLPTPEPAPSPHWLIFTSARQVTGCACGYQADLDSDCGYGDSVAEHLIDVGRQDVAR